MRINVYSQELLTDPRDDIPLDEQDQMGDAHAVVELVEQKSNTDVTYSAVRLFLHSSERLHHPPADDDRSAITFWLPKSRARRVKLAETFYKMASMVLEAAQETGLD